MDDIRLFEEMTGAAGKKRKVPVETEAFKLWLSQVGRERMEDGIDPEHAVVSIGSSHYLEGSSLYSRERSCGALKKVLHPRDINENMYFRLRCHRDNLWI